MIIVMSRLLFWLAIFRSEDRTNDEYTYILRDFEWHQSHSFHRTKQVKWPFILPNRWFLEYLGQCWNQLYEVTESKYILTRSLIGYREWSVRHGVEHGNDFTALYYAGGIIRFLSLVFLTTLIEITLLNMTWLDLNRTVQKVMVRFRYLYGLIFLKVPLVSEP